MDEDFLKLKVQFGNGEQRHFIRKNVSDTDFVDAVKLRFATDDLLKNYHILIEKI